MARPDTVVELLGELIRIPSVNPDGEPGTDQTGEGEMAAYVADYLREECGAEVAVEEVLPGRPNVLGRYPGLVSGRPRVLLAPHLDTVGVGGMTVEPFGGEVRDGKVWGRGASDTKGSLAAMLWALRELRREGRMADLPVMVAAFMGEESAQHGSRHFARHHAGEVDFGIAGEPTGLRVVRAHKACWWLEVRVRGRAVHSAKPELGENAVLKMAGLMMALERELAARLPAFEDDVLGRSTHSINQIQGGVRANVVPDECRIVVDIRATPSLFAHGVPRLVEECLSAAGFRDAALRVTGESPVLKTDPSHEVIRRLQALGADLATAPWFCDAGWLAQAGIPSVALGPGSIDQAHTVDEWIAVEDLEEGARFFTQFLRGLGAERRARSLDLPRTWLCSTLGAFDFRPAMAKQQKHAISPTREEDFPEWYQQVVRAADMAENSEVRGCMVIKPWGYGLWERIQRQMDRMFRDTGHRNAYFPLLIPLSYLEKEAQHAEGFATECAVVTHHRLETQKQEDGTVKMVPSGKLTEPLVIRPTSETIIGAAYARWVQSYRDLPILINQWANVMRWEMRPRLFLRTAEFLWQEGHTAHETREEALEETARMHRVYETFLRDHLAIPVLPGEKTEAERFPGALNTFTVEAMVQDRKAIQAGTSHFLGQNFSKAAGIEFTGRDGQKEFAWTTSWGVSTRTIGTLIMAHGDDDGVVMPPRVAPTQVVILPVTPKEESRATVQQAADQLAGQLRQQRAWDEPLEVEVDRRDLGGGTKNWEWIKKGVPVRLEIGPRDLENGTVALIRRDTGAKEFLPLAEAVGRMPEILGEIQDGLLRRAREFRQLHTREIDSLDDFRAFFTPRNPDKPEIHGGFALAHWGGTAEDEKRLQQEMKVTVRCIPMAGEMGGDEPGTCFYTGKPSVRRLVFAKSY